ncbi:SMEK domain-containing protein, partial [Vibrio cholerae]|uniref:SMEK domain-containing protein n=1 Tax=Vibrio cholerae TaxID=666 RepID=UPI0018F098BA
AIDLLTLLQLCIKNNVKQSFNDIAFSVEIVVRDLLNVLEKADYQNLNDIKPNYPAIDLQDQKQGIAIQVTTTADKKKVDKTIAMYEKKKMS